MTLVAAQRGFDVVPDSQEGTPLVLQRARRLIPHSGFAGICAPGLITWLLRTRGEFDVAHVHLARDLVLLPLATLLMRLRIPYVLQPHGMILPGAHPLAPLADRVIVGRLLHEAHEVYYLTTDERDALDEVARGRARLAPLPNGVPLYEQASGTEGVPEVLFLARLHPRKRPVDFVMAAHVLNSLGIKANYTLVGPDEGEASRVTALVAQADNIRWVGSVAPGEAPTRMRQASIYVLPSVSPEPYPMAVLEAMSVGLPVVVTEDCGLAPIIRKYNCGLVIERGAAHVARAVRTLLEEPEWARAMGGRGRAAVTHDLGMSYVGQQLETSYSEAVAQRLSGCLTAQSTRAHSDRST